MRRWAVLGALLLAAPASAATTLTERIQPTAESQPGGDFVFLAAGPGEGHVVRQDLAKARKGRAARRRSLAYFAQLSDFQLADEESPARVEVLDQASSTFSSAFRPQEALMPFAIDAAIRRINVTGRSPVRAVGKRRARLGFAILTGDNADNSQRNETRWVQTLLDGGRLDPNSGRADPQALARPSCAGADAAALAAEAPLYTGVQDYDDYAGSDDFYDPDEPAGLFAQWPRYPGLMDRAERPFDAAGLRVPSYVALGNHDALVQGNQAANSTFDATAIGCVKPFGNPLGLRRADALLRAQSDGNMLVPPDPDRKLTTKAQYRALFAGSQRDAHGFALVDPDEAQASAGAASYYSFSPARGLRMIALDTTATGGVVGIAADGNVDDPEFQWLKEELAAAAKRDELVIVFSHHGPTSLTADLSDETAGSCDDPENPSNPGCDADPRNSEPIHLGDDVVELLASEPHVIAWVAGHSHVNDVVFEKGTGGSGFWVVRTSAEADWPHQDRLVELMDNADGTLSIFGTLIDNAAPAAAPPPGDAAAFTPIQLASLVRAFGYNDPDAGLAASGEREDRNVELVVADPRRAKLRVRAKTRGATVRVRVSRAGAPVAGAAVRLGKARARTNARGRARLRGGAGRVVRVRAGTLRGRARVRR